MNELDQRIKQALERATDLPEGFESPGVANELVEVFHGQRAWLMKWAVIKMVSAGVIMLFCIYQFFQQTSTMAMMGYASAVLLCAIAYSAVALFVWIQVNHNNTVREVKKLELQIALLNQQMSQKSQGDT